MSGAPERPPEGPGEPRPRAAARAHPAGLCPTCTHVHPVTSAKGSTFLRCGWSDVDRTFPRYPGQPVLVCRGHQR